MRDVLAQLEAEIPRLRRYARYLARRPEDADDLVQDCLMRAIHRIDSYERGTNLRAWLFVILRNGFISEVRRARRVDLQDGLPADHPALTSSPAQEATVRLRELIEAFDQLPRSQQEILHLVCVDGLKYEEAAEVLGVKIGTVRSRLSRARSVLRARLEGERVREPKDDRAA